MTDKEEYNANFIHDEFLKDSSDDKPVGDYKNLEKNFAIKQPDDDMNYQQAYSYEDCIKNQSVYNDEGDFTPYSCVINTFEEHKALCKAKNILDYNIRIAKDNRD